MKWSINRETIYLGLSGTVLLYACCPGVIINSIPFYFQSVPVWTINFMVTLSITFLVLISDIQWCELQTQFFVFRDQQVMQYMQLAKRNTSGGTGGVANGRLWVYRGGCYSPQANCCPTGNVSSGLQLFWFFKISQTPDFYIKYPDFLMLATDSQIFKKHWTSHTKCVLGLYGVQRSHACNHWGVDTDIVMGRWNTKAGFPRRLFRLSWWFWHCFCRILVNISSRHLWAN